MLTSYIVAACWIAWITYWIILWRREKPVTQPQAAGERVKYTILLMLSFILILPRSHQLPGLGSHILPSPPLLIVIGAVLAVLGVSLTIWARRVLDDDWSADVAFKADQKLVTRGPYALLRHPIYAGLTLMFVGTALVEGTLGSVLAIALSFISFIIKLRQEEVLMSQHFGNGYRQYRARTKRIIPWLY